jgi:endonuclease/exonuclease/phosphatase family metal-dependent hydrolase
MPTYENRSALARTRFVVIALAGLMTALAVLLPIAEADAKKKKKKDAQITVMSRNVYLGADLGPAIGADGLAEAIDGAGEIWASVVATDFPSRSVLLADEINDAKPDLVGLQEVAHWRVQTPSDGGWTESGGIGEPATETAYDFLADLMEGLPKYEVVGVQEEFDSELPVDEDQSDATGTGPLGVGVFGADFDARLTMRDVILVRKNSKVKASAETVQMDHFENLYTADVGGIPITADRGWLSVEAKVKGSKKRKSAKFRFVNTHLEAFGDPAIREAQARELFANGGPLRSKDQVILLGDINSGGPKDKIGPGFTVPGDEGAYNALTQDFGMTKYGARQTCCYPDVFQPIIGDYRLDHTVDHILAKPKVKELDSFVTGDDPSVTIGPDKLVSSDHGGVVSKLKLKKKK